MKQFWLFFFRDNTGFISVKTFGHNASADMKDLPGYFGSRFIWIDVEKLEP